MLKNHHINSTLLILLSLAMYFISFLLFISVPVINNIKIIFIPLYFFHLVPLFFVVNKYEFKIYALPALIILLILLFFLKALAITFFINLIFPVLIFKLIFKNFKIKTFNKTYYSLILYSLLISCMVILLLRIEYFNNLYQEQINVLNNQLNITIEKFRNQNVPIKELILLENVKVTLMNIFKNYYPTLIFYSFSVLLTINFIFSILFISKSIKKKPLFINIFYIKTPEHYIWIFLLSCFLVFISFYSKNQLFKIIAINFAFISAFIYIIEGGLIFLYKFFSLKINFIIKFIILFVLLNLSFYYFKYVIVLFCALGILDYWLDFRKINQLNNKSIDTSV